MTSIRNLAFPAGKGLNFSGAKQAKEYLGDMAEWVNLRDNKDMDGNRVAIIGAEIKKGSAEYAGPDGELRDYALIACFEIDALDNPVRKLVIQTGAYDVVEKIKALQEQGALSPETPVIGTLRLTSGGRAWLLE